MWRRPLVRTLRLAPFAGVLLGLLSHACAAQTPPDEPTSLSTPDHPYVLHVYTDLLQIPTLVLNGSGKPETQLTTQNFKLQLDSGPYFQPTALHVEGNEPLNLAIVLDASGAENDLLTTLPKSSTHGLPNGLLPQDHVGVYAFDCKSLRSNIDTSAEVATAHEGIAHILASPALHPPAALGKTCADSKAVWDAVGNAAITLGAQPGRRAIILISDGQDKGSKTPLQDLIIYSVAHSIAVFVLREPSTLAIGFGSRPRPITTAEDALAQLTGHSGGIVIPVLSNDVANQLDRIVTLLRSRYILQFPRPSNGSSGTHHLDVHVSDKSAEVHAAGIAVPTRDAALMSDPNTVPSDTSKMPIVGKGKGKP